MINKIKKSQILSNKFAFGEDEEVLVNALDLCAEMVENEHLKRIVTKLQNENDILRTRLALRDIEDCKEYRKIDLRG